ncbi:hypothetical protein [Halochromatium salexigens]|uniref:Uncharacterized protein n=1 Tax=Halochromatium salexigens TaxID=49447 RepID=A0AAJ0XFY8_HALSE|nr:hypothetical protein [Halochromatium salexigens]MBK5930868.1 hypothetical protein [Halochromatium salexigens]
MLVISSDKEVSLIEADKPLKATPGQCVLWFGCKMACDSDETAVPTALTTSNASADTADSGERLPS